MSGDIGNDGPLQRNWEEETQECESLLEDHKSAGTHLMVKKKIEEDVEKRSPTAEGWSTIRVRGRILWGEID
jgi:hypothetical protein